MPNGSPSTNPRKIRPEATTCIKKMKELFGKQKEPGKTISSKDRLRALPGKDTVSLFP
jgi:hypothetical protein